MPGQTPGDPGNRLIIITLQAPAERIRQRIGRYIVVRGRNGEAQCAAFIDRAVIDQAKGRRAVGFINRDIEGFAVAFCRRAIKARQ